jgi:hypothetical protein
MRFILGVLVGYCIRGKQRFLIAILTAIAVVCFIVLPAIALSQLAISVRRERLSRPPQTSVPALIGLDYKTAQIKVRDANLNIRVLASRHDLQLEPGTIIAQTPQGGERVDCGTIIGVIMSAEESRRNGSPGKILIVHRLGLPRTPSLRGEGT